MARSPVRAWVAAGASWDRVRVRWRWLAGASAMLLVSSILVSVPSPARAAATALGLPLGARWTQQQQPADGSARELAPSTTERSQGSRGPGAPPDRPVPTAPELAPESDPIAASLGLRVPPTGTRIDALKGALAIGLPVEDPAARTANATEYVNPNGTVTRTIFQSTAFVPDPESPHGWLRPLSTVLEQEADGAWVPEAASQSRFAASAASRTLASVALPDDGGTVGFGVTGAAGVTAVLDEESNGTRVHYPGIFADTDLYVSATAEGIKDDLVLRSVSAPRSFQFPLTVPAGVTPELAEDGGVVLMGTDGKPVARIQAPFMYDSSLHPVEGGPAYSTDVTYTLIRVDHNGNPVDAGEVASDEGAGSGPLGRAAIRWALRMTLDDAWLDDPARVWPVTVDPVIGWVGVLADDAFVSSSDYAGANTSGLDNLAIGTWNGGGEKRQSYLHFNLAPLSGVTVTAARLRLVNYWSFNCDSSAAAKVHEVTVPWSGSALGAYPGPAYKSTALASANFANGWTACPNPAWVQWELPATKVQGWVTNPSSFHGLTIRASGTNSLSWKRFRSQNYSDPAQRPRLEVEYTMPVGIAALSPEVGARVGTLTPTLWVNPTVNPGVQAQFAVYTEETGYHESPIGPTWFEVPAGWIPTWGTSVSWSVRLIDGSFSSTWQQGLGFVTQVPQPPVTSHLAGAPEGAEIAGVNPQIGNYSTTATDAAVSVVGPALATTRTYNSQDPRTDGAFGPGWSTPWDQRLSVDTDGSGNVVVTLGSGRQVRFGRNADGSYSPPLGQRLDLVRHGDQTWTLRDSEGFRRLFTPDGRLTKIVDTDGREQVFSYPGGTSNVAIGATATGSDPGVCFPGQTPDKAINGTIIDANDKWCSTAASKWLRVDLGQVRTVGSVVVKHAGAGGEQTAWNTRAFNILTSVNGSAWSTAATVTGNTASVTTHTFTPVQARYVRLDVVTPTQTSDPAARIFQFEIFGSQSFNTVTDDESGRALHVQWQNGRITSVITDPPASGQQGYTWTYAYTDGRLTQVCSPLAGGQNCTEYGYQPSSHYRTVVVDDQPLGYWPMSETSGTVAVNVMAQKPGQYDGTYVGVDLGAHGLLPMSPDPAVAFEAGPGKVLDLPRHLVNTTVRESVELWFQMQPGDHGMLISEMAGGIDATSGQDQPVLYVGTDGKLHGQFFTTAGVSVSLQMSSPNRVDDGAWHHVVITADGDDQHLYLDGDHVDDLLDRQVDHLAMSYLHIGNGWASAPWPSLPTPGPAAFPFTGLIDEVAYYRYPLSETQVVDHFAARTATTRLTQITQSGVAEPIMLLGYDDATGRVATATDVNGAQWTLTQPSVGDFERSVTVAWDDHREVTYTYDTKHDGRLMRRAEPVDGLPGVPTRRWTYHDTGFVKSITDENNNTIGFVTDDRGNVTQTIRCGLPGHNPWSSPPGASCYTTYSGYYLNPADPLDPRNDKLLWQADARSSDANDQTYRTTHQLDSAGRITKTTYPKPAGVTTNPVETFAYTSTADGVPGLLKTHTTPIGTTQYTYTADGDLLTETDAVGLATTYGHDGLGRITSVQQSATIGGQLVNYGAATTIYNELSVPIEVLEPPVTNPVTGVTHTGRTTTQVDQVSGRTTSVTVADVTGGDSPRTTSFDYDDRGRLETITNADGTQDVQVWDEAGDLVSTTQAGGLTTHQTYDQAHRLIEVAAVGAGVDPQNPAANTLRLQSRSYDPAGRLTVEIDAGGHETRYEYGADDLQRKVLRIRTNGAPNLVAEERAYTKGRVTTLTLGGRVTTYTYDPAGHIATQRVDPSGVNRTTTYTYFPDGSVRSASATGAGSPGRTEKVSYTYDAAGREISSTVDNAGGSPTALTTTYTRDPRGLVITTIDPSGVAVEASYDLAGRLTTVAEAPRSIWADGVQHTGISPTTTYGYNTFGETRQVKDPNGAVTTTEYDDMGRPEKVTLPAYTPPGPSTPITPVQQTQYNDHGLPDTITDPLGNATTYVYDPYGRPTSRTDPDPDGSGPKASPVSTYSYTRTGQLARTTDPTGAYTDYHYNDLDLVDEGCVSENSQQVCYPTTYEYNAAGDVTAVVAPATAVAPQGARTEIVYNDAGDQIRITDPTGRFIQKGYDMAGRVTTIATGRTTSNGDSYEGPATSVVFDLAGRATAVRQCTANANGTCGTVLAATSYTYDAANRPLSTTSPEGRPTFYHYDTVGQLDGVTQREDKALSSTDITIGLGYDAAGRLTRYVDGNGNATTYTYNSWGLPEKTIEPATTAHPSLADRTWTTTYNAAGLAIRHDLPGGVARSATYDNLGRLIHETGTGAATADRSLDYDPVGRITTASSPAGTLTYDWTDRGLLASATGYGGTTTYTYDAIGALTQRVDPAGTIAFDYDAAGRLASVTDPLTNTIAEYGYDNAGRLTTVDRGSSHVGRSLHYDNLGRVDADTTTGSGSPPSTTYQYDLDGLLTHKTTSGVAGAGLNQYEYDDLGRVTSWLSPDGVTTTYGYDEASNRTRVQTPTEDRTASYDERNRVQTVTSDTGADVAYTWNSRGQLTATATTAGETRAYTYDAFERLVTISGSAIPTTTYGYDSLDRPAQRNGSSFGYIDLSNTPVLSPAPAGEITLLRDPAGVPLASRTGTDPAELLLTDPVHNDGTAALDPATGTPSSSASYDPWGTPTTAGAGLPLGFQGGYTDPDSGLVNAHARWYDPALAGFTSRDTWTLAPVPLPQGNRYLYANGNPLTRLDANGHASGMARDKNRPSKPEYEVTEQDLNDCTSIQCLTALSQKISDMTSRLKAEQKALPGFIKGCRGNKDCIAQLGPTPGAFIEENGSYVTTDGRTKIITITPTALLEQQEATARQEAERQRCQEDFWCRNASAVGNIAGAAAGLLVGAACTVATGGAGVVGCAMLGGFVGGFVSSMTTTFLTDPNADVGMAMAQATVVGVIGAVGGAVGGVVGAKAATALVGNGAGLLTRIVGGGLSGAVAGAPAGAVTGGAMAAISYLNECGSNCSLERGIDATVDGAVEGAKNGAIFGFLGGAFAGAFTRAPSAPSRCTGNSFAPKTPVAMANGATKPIKDVQPGDSVLATDVETGRTLAKTVTATIIGYGIKNLVDITITGGEGEEGTATLTATDGHPFWLPALQRWVDAADLTTGDWLQTSAGTWVQVTAISTRTEVATVNNLTVADIHTYYVLAGDTPVLVHNSNCPVSVNDAGRYGDLTGEVGDGLTAHHMPQNALGFAPRADGGSIVLTQADHMLTRTYGWRGAVTAVEDAGLDFRTVLAKDIWDLRRIGQQQYGDPGYFNSGIQGLLSYYRQTGQLAPLFPRGG